MKTILQEEYQQKIANLKTPEEIASFVREYAVALLGGESTAQAKRSRPKKLIDLSGPTSHETWREMSRSGGFIP